MMIAENPPRAAIWTEWAIPSKDAGSQPLFQW